ncbi:MAG: ATP-binding cassette domain-containing protein [Pseudomonadota bacterium]
MIEVRNLSKHYKAVRAVNQVCFDAADGRITALLGPNGAGKSTTLRILATVIEPMDGSAKIGGFDASTEPLQVRKAIGVLPHNSGLYARLTGIENVRYFGRLQGMDKTEVEERIEVLLGQLEMRDFAARRTAGFSQGQKIKVALARALIHNPQHVILDEPTNGLDVMATRALREIILGLKREGKCVLFSSHIMQEVEALCDDVIIIGKGEVKFSGTLDELRANAGTTDLEDAFVRLAGVEEEAGA